MCEEIAGPQARLDATPRRTASATTAGGSPTSRRSSATTRTGRCATRSRTSCGEIHDANVEHWAVGVNLSVVIPAHNEAEVVEPTLRGLIDAPRARRGSTTRSSSSTTPRRDGTGDVVRARRRQASRACAACATRRPTASASRCARGSRPSSGDAVVIVMADGSDDPRDVVLYYRVLEAGYDCAFGSRFMPGAGVHDYPRLKLLMNRIVNTGIRAALPPRLQRHHQRVQGLPARGDREPAAAALAPLQPDRRAAAEGDHARLLLVGVVDHISAFPRKPPHRSFCGARSLLAGPR